MMPPFESVKLKIKIITGLLLMNRYKFLKFSDVQLERLGLVAYDKGLPLYSR